MRTGARLGRTMRHADQRDGDAKWARASVDLQCIQDLLHRPEPGGWFGENRRSPQSSPRADAADDDAELDHPPHKKYKASASDEAPCLVEEGDDEERPNKRHHSGTESEDDIADVLGDIDDDLDQDGVIHALMKAARRRQKTCAAQGARHNLSERRDLHGTIWPRCHDARSH